MDTAHTIMNSVDGISGFQRHIRRLPRHSVILGEDEPQTRAPASPAPAAPATAAMARQDSFREFLRKNTSGAVDVPDHAGTIVGAAAGAYFVSNHRVLGVIGGASLGRNLPALFSDRLRRSALCNMGQTFAGVAGSLVARRAPFWGFVVPWLVAGGVIHFTNLRQG